MAVDTDPQASISPLAERVQYLERLLIGDLPHPPDLARQEVLVYRIANVNKEFTNIMGERKAINEFLEKYDKHQQYLSPSVPTLTLEQHILTPEAKTEIVLDATSDFAQFADEITQIKALEDVVGSVDFKSVEQNLPLLQPIEVTHHEQVVLTSSLSGRVLDITNSYNALINTLSEIFISWDHVLTAAEVQVAAAERARGAE